MNNNCSHCLDCLLPSVLWNASRGWICASQIWHRLRTARRMWIAKRTSKVGQNLKFVLHRNSIDTVESLVLFLLLGCDSRARIDQRRLLRGIAILCCSCKLRLCHHRRPVGQTCSMISNLRNNNWEWIILGYPMLPVDLV